MVFEREPDGEKYSARYWFGVEDLQQNGIVVSSKAGAHAWLRASISSDTRSPWLLRAIQTLDNAQCPADLGAFMSELLVFA